MRFGPVALGQAEGKILGHNISDTEGNRMLRKGSRLTAEDLKLLAGTGRQVVYVAELMPDDVDEDTAAERVARAVGGASLHTSGAHVGRVNLRAKAWSVLRVDASRLARINACEGLTLATLRTHAVVGPRKIAATIKVIPFALPESIVRAAEAIAGEDGPVIRLHPLRQRAAALILSSSPLVEARVTEAFVPALQGRLEALGSELRRVDFVPLEDEAGELALAETIRTRVSEGAEIVLLAGETAIMDRHDIAPRAVERAGGEVACYGAPVDPGNLLMLAYLDGVPILGAPGCVRSPKTNIIDWVLPPLLAGDPLTREDILQMGHGGLLEDISQRPMPREGIQET